MTPAASFSTRRLLMAALAITILTPALLAVGRVLATYPGCDGTWNTCINKFNNWKNYGGQPWIPIKNPMGGESIY